jgi:hypothetical protein
LQNISGIQAATWQHKAAAVQLQVSVTRWQHGTHACFLNLLFNEKSQNC